MHDSGSATSRAGQGGHDFAIWKSPFPGPYRGRGSSKHPVYKAHPHAFRLTSRCRPENRAVRGWTVSQFGTGSLRLHFCDAPGLGTQQRAY